MTEFRDRLQWHGAEGEVRDGATRYMLVRPDALMGMFARLPDDLRATALEALGRSIVEFGGKSAGNYKAALSASDNDLMAVIERTAPQLGWGIWRIERRQEAIDVTVDNSPFASGIGTANQPVCAAIAGMLEVAATLAEERPMRARETDCAATGAESCRFHVAPVDPA